MGTIVPPTLTLIDLVKKPEVVVPTLLSLVAILVGLSCIHDYFKTKRKIADAQQWPFVLGTVDSSQIKEEISNNSKGGSSHYYFPDVVYRYRAVGKDLTGKAISFVRVGYGSREKAEEVLRKYPVGARIRVLYNPDKAEEAVLDPEGEKGKLLLLAGFIFIILGLGSSIALFLYVMNGCRTLMIK
jgi:hypothetical protein